MNKLFKKNRFIRKHTRMSHSSKTPLVWEGSWQKQISAKASVRGRNTNPAHMPYVHRWHSPLRRSDPGQLWAYKYPTLHQLQGTYTPWALLCSIGLLVHI